MQHLNYKYEADKQRINYVVKFLIYNNIEDKEEIKNILEVFGISADEKFATVIMKVNYSRSNKHEYRRLLKINSI